jgi:4-hydroxy-3-methylbut-2-enyl diphosphate reductase
MSDGSLGVILVPTRLEERIVKAALAQKGPRARGGAGRASRGLASEVKVLRTGMGPRRMRGFLARHPEVAAAGPVVLLGFGGALTRDLGPGDVVVADMVRAPEGEIRLASPALLASHLRESGLRVRCGSLYRSERVVRGEPLRILLARTGSLAVDMESFEAGFSLGTLPGMAIVRVISDGPAFELGTSSFLRSLPKALESLRQAAGAVADFLSMYVPGREVVLAEPRSFCAGVERAIEIVERALEIYGAPVYVRKEIVHNKHVVSALADKGAVFVDEVDEVPEGATVIFSAHGVSPAVRRLAEERRLDVIDATCPLVTKVHQEARRFASRGYQIVLIGHRDHEETEGTLGEVPGMRLVQGVEEARMVELPAQGRLAYLTQTTLAVDEVEEIVGELRKRRPDIEGPPAQDICYATQNRQDAVAAVARIADVVLVIGSKNSSNSKRLVEVAQRFGAEAYLVDDETEIMPSWLAGARRVGLTAGASAPDVLVARVVDALRAVGVTRMRQVSVATESVRFQLPRAVKRQPVKEFAERVV